MPLILGIRNVRIPTIIVGRDIVEARISPLQTRTCIVDPTITEWSANSLTRPLIRSFCSNSVCFALIQSTSLNLLTTT